VAILANRVKVKSRLVGASKALFLTSNNSVGFLLLIFAFVLFYVRSEIFMHHNLELTGRLMNTAQNFYSSTASGIRFVYNKTQYFSSLEQENLRLKMQLEQLTHLQYQNHLLARENNTLKAFLSVAEDINPRLITAKIVGSAFSPFSNSITLQAGSKDGVQLYDMVRSHKGLVGCVSQVSDNYSVVRLITDHESRVPVQVQGQNLQRGILIRQDGQLKIAHVENAEEVHIGSLVYSSGDGKIFAKDIPIATVTHVENNEVFVKLLEDYNNLQFVFVYSPFREGHDANLSANRSAR